MLSPERLNANSIPISADEDEITWDEPPSSPFVSHIEHDQENIAPHSAVAPTPVKPLINFDDDVPQSAFKISSPSKSLGLKDRGSPIKLSPAKPLLDDTEDMSFRTSYENLNSPKKSSPVKQTAMDHPESAMSDGSRKASPSKTSRTASVEPAQRFSDSIRSNNSAKDMSPVKRPSSSHHEPELRENQGLTVAMEFMEETRSEIHETSSTYQSINAAPDMDDFSRLDDTEFNPDGPEATSVDIDDTCFSAFSEMPNLDMTKFAFMRKSPTKNGLFDQVRN